MIVLARTPDGQHHLLDETRFPMRVGDTIEWRFGPSIVSNITFEADGTWLNVDFPDASERVGYRVKASEAHPFRVVDGPDLQARRRAEIRFVSQGCMFQGVGPMEVECVVQVMIIPRPIESPHDDASPPECACGCGSTLGCARARETEKSP